MAGRQPDGSRLGNAGNGILLNAMREIRIRDEFIKLGQALKLAGIADTGADAKLLVEEGGASVNGEVDTRRGRKLRDGDVVTAGGESFTVRSAAKPAEDN